MQVLHDQTQSLAGVTMLAVSAATVLQGLQGFTSLAMASGALLAGVSSLLPALAGFLDRRQARRHREDLHRVELARRPGEAP